MPPTEMVPKFLDFRHRQYERMGHYPTKRDAVKAMNICRKHNLLAIVRRYNEETYPHWRLSTLYIVYAREKR